MKSAYLCVAVLAFVFFGCNSGNSSQTPGTASTRTQDSTEIVALIRNVYKWHETAGPQADFSPAEGSAQDTAYVGLDMSRHWNRLAELRQTGFFSAAFLDNYDRIATDIHQDLQNGTVEWLIGDVSPYSPDINPWCNCQDYPDRYWETITVSNISGDSNEKTFDWTWGAPFIYSAKAQKENGTWKISYLQGFDYTTFTGKTADAAAAPKCKKEPADGTHPALAGIRCS